MSIDVVDLPELTTGCTATRTLSRTLLNRCVGTAMETEPATLVRPSVTSPRRPCSSLPRRQKAWLPRPQRGGDDQNDDDDGRMTRGITDEDFSDQDDEFAVSNGQDQS